MSYNTRGWTFGAEHELVDWDRKSTKHPLPVEFKIDERDVTMVNSNGIAVDPKARLYPLGGEINTPPSDSIAQQCLHLRYCRNSLGAKINYRSNLHLHIRVPGLKDDLRMLKQIARYCQQHLKDILPRIEPMWHIPSMWTQTDARDKKLYTVSEWTEGAKRRLRRCRVSHHTVVPGPRVEQQLKAKSFEAFMAAECPIDRKGRVMWHAAPRAAVNLRQLMQTDTIEFRHWPGTLDVYELENAFHWCFEFLKKAMFQPDDSPVELLNEMSWVFPKWQPYCHWQEVGYRATCHDGSLKSEQITKNIYAILEERFDFARGLPREH